MQIAKLKGKMAEVGVSQAELAKKIGTSKNTLNARFTGRVPFDLEQVERICHALGINNDTERAQIFLR